MYSLMLSYIIIVYCSASPITLQKNAEGTMYLQGVIIVQITKFST